MAVEEEDVKSVLAKNREAFDFGYIKQWLSEFSKLPEYEGLLAKCNGLLEQ